MDTLISVSEPSTGSLYLGLYPEYNLKSSENVKWLIYDYIPK
jgi:hypothetical protein